MFLFAVIALNPPLLSVFSTSGSLFGLPVLYVYLFIAWAALVVLMALNAEGRRRHQGGRRQRPQQDRD